MVGGSIPLNELLLIILYNMIMIEKSKIKLEFDKIIFDNAYKK